MRYPRAISILFLAPAVALAVACAPQPTVDSVLDAAEQAAGAEALAAVQAVRIEARGTWSSPAMNIPPTPFEAEYIQQFPDKAIWRIRPEAGGMMTMAFDGASTWSSWMAPAARHTGWMDRMIREYVAESNLLYITPARAEGFATFTLASTEPEGDPPAYRMTFAPASGGEWTVWFDQASGHLVRGEHSYRFMDGQPMQGRWERSEPKTFGEVTMPSKVRFEGRRDGELFELVEETVVAVEWNPELPAEVFGMPEAEIDLAEIGIKTVPPMTVVAAKHVGPYDKLAVSLESLMDKVFAAGLMPAGPICATYVGDPAKVAPESLETGLAIPVMLEGEPPQLPEGLTLERWPETTVAFAFHRGEFAGEAEAHARLMAWMKQNRKRAAGPSRGMWFHDPEVVVAEDLLTEVQVPIR